MSLTSEDMKDLNDICDDSGDQLFYLVIIGMVICFGVGYLCS